MAKIYILNGFSLAIANIVTGDPKSATRDAATARNPKAANRTGSKRKHVLRSAIGRDVSCSALRNRPVVNSNIPVLESCYNAHRIRDYAWLIISGGKMLVFLFQNMGAKKSLVAAALMTSAAILAPVSQAEAQSGGASDSAGNAIETVVVTSEKRAERVQDVPASISVMTSEDLQDKTATDYSGYLNSIPSVSYTATGGYKDKIFIRGLSDSLSSRVLSTTGIYIDETPVTEVDASLADIGTFDINRVEVLRGPQGTLYGSESMGGTVRIITNKPDLREFSSEFKGDVSSTEHGGANYGLNAMVNVPIVQDKLGLRVDLSRIYNSGFIDNAFTGQGDVNDNHSTSFRAELAGKPAPNLDVLLTFQYQRTTDNAGPFQDLGLPRYTEARAYPETNKFNTKIFSATINYDLSFASLTSATSYIDKTNFSVRDLTQQFGVPIASFYNSATGDILPPDTGIGLTYSFPNKDFVQEVRMTSNGDGPLNWLVGLYYNDFTPTDHQSVTTTNGAANAITYYYTNEKTERREFAEFAELGYRITPALQFTAGVRQANYRLVNNETAIGPLVGGLVVSDTSAKESALVGKFRLDYKVSDDNLIYTQASQGFRPGGVNGTLPSSCEASLRALGYPDAASVQKYDPDSVWDYEVGSKNQLFDNRVTLNADAYYIDWKQAQVAQNLACSSQIISNSGGAVSKGVELDIFARPVDYLSLSLNGSFTESTFNKTIPSVQIVAGATLPNVPKWQINASATYSRPITNDLTGFVHADVSYNDSRYSQLPSVSVNPREPGYSIVNARVGVNWDRWELALFAKNLTNQVAILDTSDNTGYYFQDINQPRTIGLEVDAQF